MVGDNPKFAKEQRARLKTLGLHPVQIDELQRVLTTIRVFIQPPPTMDSVRQELRVFKSAVDKAHKQADKLANPEKHAQDKIRERKEAEGRLEIAANDLAGMDALPQLSESLEGLRTLARIIQKAFDDLPKKQRHAFADYRPVARIDEALLRGFTKAHNQPLPPYLLSPSSSEGSTFREIVGICYQAMGRDKSDPERAIKTYLRVRKKRRDDDRKKLQE